MYNLICPHTTAKGLKLASVPMNEKKAAEYADFCSLPENEGHVAWMVNEIACAAKLLKHVTDKTPWTGYDAQLLATHRDDDGKVRSVIEYSCLDSFFTSTSKDKKSKKVTSKEEKSTSEDKKSKKSTSKAKKSTK